MPVLTEHNVESTAGYEPEIGEHIREMLVQRPITMKPVHIVIVADSTLMLSNRDDTDWNCELKSRIIDDLWRQRAGLQVPNHMDFVFSTTCIPGGELSDLVVVVNDELKRIQSLKKDVFLCASLFGPVMTSLTTEQEIRNPDIVELTTTWVRGK